MRPECDRFDPFRTWEIGHRRGDDSVGKNERFAVGSLYGTSLTGAVAGPILAAAKAADCVTVADMMHADRGSISDAAIALRHVDFFLPNEAEATALTQTSDPAAAATVLAAIGVKCVVIKMGTQGCLALCDGDVSYVKGVPAEAVDTTGAGDAFVAGFVSGIADGLGPLECARRRCAAGSLAVRVVGATGWASSKDEVLALCG
jgi:sugar/nucleoside kinase (ribokinase family)